MLTECSYAQNFQMYTQMNCSKINLQIFGTYSKVSLQLRYWKNRKNFTTKLRLEQISKVIQKVSIFLVIISSMFHISRNTAYLMIAQKINVINSFKYVAHRLILFGAFVMKGNAIFQSDLKVVLYLVARGNLELFTFFSLILDKVD